MYVCVCVCVRAFVCGGDVKVAPSSPILTNGGSTIPPVTFGRGRGHTVTYHRLPRARQISTACFYHLLIHGRTRCLAYCGHLRTCDKRISGACCGQYLYAHWKNRICWDTYLRKRKVLLW